MSLPLLYAQPDSDSSWRSWSFNHAANHYDIVSAAGDQFNIPVLLTTNAESPSGFTVIQFESIPTSISGSKIILAVSDVTTPNALAVGTILVGFSTTEIKISPAVAGTVGDGDVIQFLPVAPVNLTQFSLDPMDPDNLGLWMYQHQVMHDQANALLGYSGFDLLGLDWDEPDQFAEWLRLNGDEHLRISTALGVG